jgi:lipoate-protein ligase B
MNRSSLSSSGLLALYDRLPYATAWELQRALVQERLEDRRPDTLLLLEHDPVYTIGRRGQAAHWGGDETRLGCPVYHVERGGSITYHGPGQVVGYPILRLERRCPGPKAYVDRLEEVVIRTLARWDITGTRRQGLPGVWVEGTPPLKIAAIGVRLVRGVTMHGFALNVSVDLSPFHRIVPCGIDQCRVTSMAALLGASVEPRMVRQHVAEIFADLFGLAWAHPDAADALVSQGGTRPS